MFKQTASLAVFLSLVVTAGCDRTEPGVLDPTPLGTGLTTSAINLHPSVVTVQPISQPFCPTVTPFIGSIGLGVQSLVDFPLSVRLVRLTFVDSFGITAPPVTLPAPVPTIPFGSALIEARAQQNFSLTFPFGCGTTRRGTVVIVVVVSDGNGNETTAETRVGVQ